MSVHTPVVSSWSIPRNLSSQQPHDERPRFLSEDDCRDIARRLASVARGGGFSAVQIVSTWTGGVRWARNQISTASEVRDNLIVVTRNVNGAHATVSTDQTSTIGLTVAARQAERLALMQAEAPERDLITRLPLEAPEPVHLFSDATYQLDADHRTSAAITLAQRAATMGMLSAGDIKVTAQSLAVIDSFGRALYFPYTQAQYSVTVRDPKGTSSGWAGTDHYDWAKIDAEALTARALEKCLQSQHPVRVEPGRYTTILEPQAVSDFVGALFSSPPWMADPMSLTANLKPQTRGIGPFNKVTQPIPYTMLGDRVVDERITISADPMDPEFGFPPFSLDPTYAWGDPFTVPVYHEVTWIDKGVLTNLAYNRAYAIRTGRNTGLPNSGAFRMSGGPTSIDEMIATTKRGVLVTRFDQVTLAEYRSQLYRGYTRDGLWLIENGKISRPVKNLTFTESVLFALNNVEQLGTPQRVFHAGAPFPWIVPQPRIVPPLKIRDFSFTSLTDAV